MSKGIPSKEEITLLNHQWKNEKKDHFDGCVDKHVQRAVDYIESGKFMECYKANKGHTSKCTVPKSISEYISRCNLSNPYVPSLVVDKLNNDKLKETPFYATFGYFSNKIRIDHKYGIY